MPTMTSSRRVFLSRSLAVAAGFGGLQSAMARGVFSSLLAAEGESGYGPLIPDPNGILDLPRGFRYAIVDHVGDRMDDGLLVPGKPDGMAAFPGPDGLTIVVRNHELSRGSDESPFKNGVPSSSLRDRIFDFGAGSPIPGGTSTFVYDTNSQQRVRSFLSLVGTERNCAGGPTPRNSWITCEETVSRAKAGEYDRDHGYCFEVPALAEPVDGSGLVRPEPIVGMGRMNHEACATSPATGIVYQTEDRHDGLIYRFLPRNPSRLTEGGRLQALVIDGQPQLDTRNWGSNAGLVRPGQSLPCRWIDLDNVEAPDDDLRYRGFEAGAARFARGEGMWYGDVERNGRTVPCVFFACTNGGVAKAGQIWRLELPNGPDEAAAAAGSLSLFIEPNDRGVLENADNITLAPSGDMIVCEDGSNEQFLVGVTPDAQLYKFARNAMSASEFAGACFSPDGSTLFVNVQHDGLTLAITGPWRT